MKIRNGFVSNSSSSSFTCVVCGEEASGMDMCHSDCDMVQTSDGDDICTEHVDEFLKEKGLLDEYHRRTGNGDDDEIDSDSDDYIDEWDGLPKEFCPMHQMYFVSDSNLQKYLLQELGKTRDQVVAEMREKFADIDEFKAYLKK